MKDRVVNMLDFTGYTVSVTALPQNRASDAGLAAGRIYMREQRE